MTSTCSPHTSEVSCYPAGDAYVMLNELSRKMWFGPTPSKLVRQTTCRVVVPSEHSVGLIDSIFRNFYVPPVIFGMLHSRMNYVLRSLTGSA